jgi:hypothetical protein
MADALARKEGGEDTYSMVIKLVHVMRSDAGDSPEHTPPILPPGPGTETHSDGASAAEDRGEGRKPCIGGPLSVWNLRGLLFPPTPGGSPHPASDEPLRGTPLGGVGRPHGAKGNGAGVSFEADETTLGARPGDDLLRLHLAVARARVIATRNFSAIPDVVWMPRGKIVFGRQRRF